MSDLTSSDLSSSDLTLNGIAIDDTFAEAFGMAATAIVLTADTPRWAEIAAASLTGFATSVIGCGVEAGIDRPLSPEETPDGRPGLRILLFGFDAAGLGKQLARRVGQCVLTSPGSACYAGSDGTRRLKLGANIRYFGDGYETAKGIGGHRYWRVPVMDGEFVCEHDTGLVEGAVGGGNLLFLGRDQAGTLAVAEAAARAAAAIPDAILPFPGGIVRSGSKVGGRTKGMIASTNDAYCPTLKGRARSALAPEVGAVLEIVIDGFSAEAVRASMRAGLHAAVEAGPQHGLVRVTAGNYGGKLGKYHFPLRELLT
ncbi:formylmethanofuran--tetrahydromethanopterin N-formyltransferase [Labrys sp. LIt4]|uniref:Formylmethanofuran--tetrahydromethanopterin formyltransferase n=1 Tax=Labrys okinawensis TaxID=346911 RepID=A0A2S9Q9B5_9HYPH|nr:MULTISPECIES: formylmethanofuran--tetrahydromethanopterin N-formyltransferase [Labrys]MBP0580592.1 formylmethanofuran--tetrahydromethanopterin N-formyltransferase [Labrys sp. LIt4]PRH85939.1 formylmethanofuran--tetrahydromethanopterin N-formyltransferase [Labrys okinawensis]